MNNNFTSFSRQERVALSTQTNAMLSTQLLSQNFPLRETITVSDSTDTRTEQCLIHPSNRQHQLSAKEHHVFQNSTISACRFRERTPKPGVSMASEPTRAPCRTAAGKDTEEDSHGLQPAPRHLGL